MIAEDKHHTLTRIQEIISDLLSIDLHDVKPDANILTDLGADSLDQVEILMAIEEEFNLEIPDTVSAHLSKATIAEFVEYIDSQHKD